MKTADGLTEGEIFELMFAKVGDGWININLLANLTARQLATAHIFEYDIGELVIDVWLNDGEHMTLAGGFKNEKVAETVMYYIKPKANPAEYKDLKVDGLAVFEFRPNLG
jgi:hypothetical protein